MIVSRIQKNGKQYEVYGEDGYLFSLYKGEIKRFHIAENAEIEDSLIEEIYQTVLWKRARERALYLLDRKPYSISELTDKLMKNRYPESVIEQVIEFLKKYGYADDEKYAELYVNSYISKRSRKQIRYDLLRKGVEKEIVEECLEQCEEAEQNGFEKLFLRYVNGKDLSDYSVRQKVFRYFYGKGFSTSLIEKTITGYRQEYE